MPSAGFTMGYCQLPAPLKSGDRLRVVTPSGALREQESFWKGVNLWRSRGYDVEVPTGYDQRWGYLAGEDAQRRQQLLDGLKDPDCKGILCARGGFGGSRLLEDWQWPDVPPKWLVGFSDITSLLWSLAKSGIAGVHGPLLTTLEIEPAWSQQRLFDWIEGRAVPPIQGLGWVGGQVTAPLLPANLTVATHLLGTAHEPDLAGVILAFEDVTEAPYRIDRMLTHWRMMGKLAAVKGVAIGRFSRCEPTDQGLSFPAEAVLRERLTDLGIPVVGNLPFGHDGVNAMLPVGMAATLDGDAGTLAIAAPPRRTEELPLSGHQDLEP